MADNITTKTGNTTPTITSEQSQELKRMVLLQSAKYTVEEARNCTDLDEGRLFVKQAITFYEQAGGKATDEVVLAMMKHIMDKEKAGERMTVRELEELAVHVKPLSDAERDAWLEKTMGAALDNKVLALQEMENNKDKDGA